MAPSPPTTASKARGAQPPAGQPDEDATREVATQQQEAADASVVNNAPIGARVIKAGEKVTLSAADVEADTFVVVKEDVYREFYPEGTKRPSYQLLFHKGQQVLKSQLEQAAGTPVRATEQNSPSGTAERKDAGAEE